MEQDFKKEYTPHHARDIMTKHPKLLHEDQTFSDALNLMDKFGFRHLPIINAKDIVVGIIGEKDLIRVKGNPKVKELISDKVLTCLEQTRIQDIAKIMLYEKLSAMPIINDDHVLIGIITQSDILEFVTHLMPIDLKS